MYIAINHREKSDCRLSNCPSDGLLIYNTNVVFDRNGRVIARYRKYNLFGEIGTNITSVPNVSTFTTDFGVTFGQFICFDILFETPTLTLIREKNVTDIIFSSHWFSELPFLYSVEAHAAWAYANDANVLSAGYNNPDTASGGKNDDEENKINFNLIHLRNECMFMIISKFFLGSGIFIGRHGYDHVILENKKLNTLLVSKIPKIINGKRLLGIDKDSRQMYRFSKSEINTTDVSDGPENYVHKRDHLETYATQILDPESTQPINNTLCYGEHCCHFEIKMEFEESTVRSNFAQFYR